MTDQVLRIEGLEKIYPKGSVRALTSFDFTQRRGEFISILGSSGCGKTTLLRMIAGLVRPSAGQIYVDGAPSHGPSLDKAMVFQQFNLFPWRTVRRNAAYGLELQGVKRQVQDTIVDKYLTMVNLLDFADHYPAELSGGMQQRVGIVRALVVEPKLLLMDEPFGALDAMTRESLQAELTSIVEASSSSVLFVTHSVDEAIYLSDRIVLMASRPGRKVREFVVDLPRPRSDYDVRSSPAFLDLANEIRSLLKAVSSD